MPKISKNVENVKNIVCQFYIDHKQECDTQYALAERNDFGEMYEKIDEQHTIKVLFSKVAIVIMTANKYEKNVLHHHIFASQKEKIKKIEIKLFPKNESGVETYAYWFQWQNYTVLHIEAQQTGSYTLGGAADIVRYIINSQSIYPMAVISFGICFGADENKYSLGDVAISKKVYPYFMGAKIEDTGYFVPDDNMFRVNSLLSARIGSIMDENAFSKTACNVYFGNYITGEAVVSREKARDEFVNIIKEKIIAGEMEGYGLFKECNGYAHSIPCLIIKSISDWAVAKNFDTEEIFKRIGNNAVTPKEQETLKDRIQAFAVFQAYHVVNIMLSKKDIFENSVYDKLVCFMDKLQSQVIMMGDIREEVQKIVTKNTKMQVSDSFITTLISNLNTDGWINCAGFNYEGIKKKDDTMWNYSSRVTGGNRNG